MHIADQDILDWQNSSMNQVVHHTWEVGRPQCGNILEKHQLLFLRDNLGLQWADIARCLGISERTLKRRYELGWLSQDSYTNLSDERLDDHVRAVFQTTPQIG